MGKITCLKNDISNILNHVSGDHEKCLEYFCQRKNFQEKNYLLDFKNCLTLLCKIENYIENLIRDLNANSLIRDVDSNIVEQFNLIVVKFVGGKRINLSQRGLYTGRCNGAVVAFNTRTPHYKFHKVKYGSSLNSKIKKMEISRRAKNLRQQNRTNARKRLFEKGNQDYGSKCLKPDMTSSEFEEAKIRFLEKLAANSQERQQIERETQAQAQSEQWKIYRRKILTASNFYRVCARKQTTSCV